MTTAMSTATARRPRPLRTLRARLLLALALVGVLPLAVIGLGGAALHREVVAEQSTRELTRLAQGLAGHIEAEVDHLLVTTRALAALPEIASMDPPRQEAMLKELYHHYYQFARLTTFDRSGRRLASSHPGSGPSIAERPWFRRTVDRGEQAWDVAASLMSGRWSLIITTPIRDADRRVVGVLGAVVDLEHLSALLGQVALGGGRAFVLDGSGYVLLHPEPRVVQGREDYSWLGVPMGGHTAGPGTVRYLLGGEPYVAGYAPVPDTGWTVVVERPEAEVLAPAEQLWRLAVAGVAASTALALFAAIWLSRALTRPLRTLAAAAQAFGAGDPVAPLPRLPHDDDELSTLVAAFRSMRAEVAGRTAALERLHAASALLHHTADLGGTLQALVQHAVELTDATFGGLALPEDGELVARHVVGVPAERIDPLPPAAQAWMERICAAREPLLVNDVADPRIDPSLVEAWRLRNLLVVPLVGSGEVRGLLGLCNKRHGDFTAEDQRLLSTLASEAAIVLENAELTRQAAHAEALRELTRQQRRTINLVAHELRTPLSYLVGYSELLLHREPTPELLREGLSTIYRGALQLRDVVTDIVELSQLETGQLVLERQAVDLARLLPAWVAELASPPRVQVRVDGALPPIAADPARLRHVVGHLVRNALKFSPSDTVVEVEVGPAASSGVQIRVRDRGCGIASDDQDRIFDMFYRTTQADSEAAPGSGLGLALVKRLVELHGGTVEVESALGAGSTFTVALPLNAALSHD